MSRMRRLPCGSRRLKPYGLIFQPSLTRLEALYCIEAVRSARVEGQQLVVEAS